jgi:hypothetical protein
MDVLSMAREQTPSTGDPGLCRLSVGMDVLVLDEYSEFLAE